MKQKTIYSLLFLFLTVTVCGGESKEEVQKRIDTLNLAIVLKVQECGSRPEFPLIQIDKKTNPPEYGTRACTVEIIFQKCPFTTYPLICLEFYKYDVPNSGPSLLKLK